MIDFIFGLILILLVVASVTITYNIFARRIFSALIDSSPEELKTLLIKEFPVLYVETIGSQLYLYDQNSDSFKGQASSIEELAKQLHETHKDMLAARITRSKNKESPIELWFINGDVVSASDISIEFEQVN